MLGINGVVFACNIAILLLIYVFFLETAETVVNLGRDVDFDKAGTDAVFELEGYKVLFFPFQRLP